MIGSLGRHGAAATLGQQCPQMTQRRCISYAHFIGAFVLLKSVGAHRKRLRREYDGEPIVMAAAERASELGLEEASAGGREGALSEKRTTATDADARSLD